MIGYNGFNSVGYVRWNNIKRVSNYTAYNNLPCVSNQLLWWKVKMKYSHGPPPLYTAHTICWIILTQCIFMWSAAKISCDSDKTHFAEHFSRDLLIIVVTTWQWLNRFWWTIDLYAICSIGMNTPVSSKLSVSVHVSLVINCNLASCRC